MPVADAACPLLAMSGGFSCQAHPLTLANCFLTVAPIFIPSGEEVAGTVSVIPNLPSMLQAIYLPAASSLPVGMFWKTMDLAPEMIVEAHASRRNRAEPVTKLSPSICVAHSSGA